MGKKLYIALKFLIRVLELLIAVTKDSDSEKKKESEDSQK